jgi:ZIP family zinc transporter
MKELFAEHQGWILTFLSSLMGIIGAASIYLDLVIHFFNRRSRFNIKKNEKFLIYGFSLSAGSLTLTSLYKLLPEAYQYFEKCQAFERVGPNFNVMMYFIGGTVVCILFNKAVHYFTSESIVHCNHGGDEDHDHSHNPDHSHEHSHFDSHAHAHTHTQTEAHSHSHSTSSGDSDDDKNHTHSHHDVHDEEQLIEGHGSPAVTEITPLVATRPSLEPRKSIFETAFTRFTNGQHHQCTGINDENCNGNPVCFSKELTHKVSVDIQNLDFYRDLQVKRSKSSLVAYTQHTMTMPPFESQIISNITNAQLPADIMLTNEPNLDLHTSHKDDHHHMVNTPISRLLSIGLQTCLALTLHKLPEGFITYATSKADPELGISIFLSLAIHNIIEGFSMTLPLYLALDSRARAFGITFVLCGFSQPFGALLAYLFLQGREINEDGSFYVFGVLISITAGFLMIISLQMFASAIQFGGSTNQVIKWCVMGMSIILLSSTLTEYGKSH